MVMSEGLFEAVALLRGRRNGTDAQEKRATRGCGKPSLVHRCVMTVGWAAMRGIFI